MRTLLFSTAIIFYSTLFAQDNTTGSASQNELKLNLAYSLLDFPEITYERIINEQSALGLSVAFSLEKDAYYRFGATPFYRFYFGKQIANGFFVEANSSIYSMEIFEYSTTGSETSSNKMIFGLGTAVGGKFLNRDGWIGEIYGGFGRNLGNKEELDWGYPRFGFVIGKRF